MKFKNILVALLTVSALNAHAAGDGAEGGGGGGGICLQNGSCITLSEAGLRIQDIDAFEIEQDVIEEIKKLSLVVPSWFGFSVENVIGAIGVIRPVLIESEGGFKRIVKKYTDDYRSALKSQSSKGLSQNFNLIAFSHNRITYLILDRYYRLPSARSKALLLVHELHMRNNAKLIDALRFDGILLDYLNAKNQNKSFDMVPLYTAHMKMTGEVDANRFSIFLELLRATGRKTITDIEIFDSEVRRDHRSVEGISLDYSQILNARKVRPTIAQELEPGTINRFRTNISGKSESIFGHYKNGLSVDILNYTLVHFSAKFIKK